MVKYPKPKYDLGRILATFWATILTFLSLNTYQLRMLYALSICRTAQLGGHKYACNECGHTHIAYNSCRNRHCPKCQTTNRERWIEQRLQNLLAVKHFHVVFTLPDSLNELCIAYPKELYDMLFEATAYTIETFSRDEQYLGAQTGMIAVLHTWGQTLSLHPHLHLLIPAGGLTDKGYWKTTRSNGSFLFPVKAMSKVFRAKFVKQLRAWNKAKNRGIQAALFEQLFQKEWVIYAKQPFLGPQQVVEYLGRYSHKVAISNHRITKVDEEQQSISFNYKDYRQAGKMRNMTLKIIEFIRRFALHILPKGFRKIRYYGLFANRNKAKLKQLAQKLNKGKNEKKHKQEVTNRVGDNKQGKIIANNTCNEESHNCPVCKKGTMILVASVLPKRAPPTAAIN